MRAANRSLPDALSAHTRWSGTLTMTLTRIALAGLGLALSTAAMAQSMPDAMMVQPEVAPGAAVAPLTIASAQMPQFVQLQGASGTLTLAAAAMPQVFATSGLRAFDVAGIKPVMYDTDIATGSLKTPMKR